MFAHRDTRVGGVDDRVVVDVAFTDRSATEHGTTGDELDLARLDEREKDARLARSVATVAAVFAADRPVSHVVGMHQVHGADVAVVEGPRTPGEPAVVADGLVTTVPGLTLLVRAADCVPLLLADVGAGVVAAVHAGRPGLVAGVAPRAVAVMRSMGAGDIEGWLGPHVCGDCYEVPAAMQADVCDLVPAARATTSWGTPSVDIGAGVLAQLAEVDVPATDLRRCTMEDERLWSYRREGAGAGRLGGLIRIRP